MHEMGALWETGKDEEKGKRMVCYPRYAWVAQGKCQDEERFDMWMQMDFASEYKC